MKRQFDSTSETKNVCDFYFNLSQPKKVSNVGTAQEVKTFACSCGVERKVKTKSGYSNLMSHIKEQHVDYEKVYQEHIAKVY